MHYLFFIFIGREPDIAKVPGITPPAQPELQGLETSVKMGLDLEYEKDGMYIIFLVVDLKMLSVSFWCFALLSICNVDELYACSLVQKITDEPQ